MNNYYKTLQTKFHSKNHQLKPGLTWPIGEILYIQRTLMWIRTFGLFSLFPPIPCFASPIIIATSVPSHNQEKQEVNYDWQSFRHYTTSSINGEITSIPHRYAVDPGFDVSGCIGSIWRRIVIAVGVALCVVKVFMATDDVISDSGQFHGKRYHSNQGSGEEQSRIRQRILYGIHGCEGDTITTAERLVAQVEVIG